MKNINLFLSIGILIPVALGYGIAPKTVLPLVFDIRLDTVDMLNICRTIMVLYIGIIAFLLRGVFIKAQWQNATLLNGIFMGSLAVGRLLSWILDGQPSFILVFGFFGELGLSLFAFYQLRKFYKKTDSNTEGSFF